MIHIGLSAPEKLQRVREYVAAERPSRVVEMSPPRFAMDISGLGCPAEHVDWDELIEYRTFYRLLREVDHSTLLVINECLRTTNRADLTYNCIRNYLTRTERQLVFNRFPALESPDDSMILVDLDTRSRWRRSKLADVGEPIRVEVSSAAPSLLPLDVPTDSKTRAFYGKRKRALIDGIGAKDPHTIPRQPHLLAGKHKEVVALERGGLWVGRNDRLKIPGFATYQEAAEPRQVLEFCHSYRDWSDYLTAGEVSELPVLVSDLRVDHWYLERYQQWTEMQRNACSALQQHQCR